MNFQWSIHEVAKTKCRALYVATKCAPDLPMAHIHYPLDDALARASDSTFFIFIFVIIFSSVARAFHSFCARSTLKAFDDEWASVRQNTCLCVNLDYSYYHDTMCSRARSTGNRFRSRYSFVRLLL